MREKIKVPKVNDCCSVSKLYEWKVDLGERFESGDVVCVIDNLSDKHNIEASKGGMLVEKVIYENSIVEDFQIIGVFEVAPEEEGDDSNSAAVEFVHKILSKIGKNDKQ
ncbi:MAG: hypothetical protein RR561_06420 [Peptostreptococcus sp.]|uniref:hypothetical protein n=1 Tax=Peptostreptococcus sp. TaxID=1262 RepID=UPI002FCA6FC8